MVRNSIRNSVVSIIVLFCVAISTMPAYASWESGINVITTVDGDLNEKQTFDTPEDYTTEVMRLVNAERANDGLPELSCSDTLVLPADIRAKESALLFAHKRPDGRNCSTVYSDCGLNYRSAGENLAYGYSNPSDLVKAWMNSKSHRENILSKNFIYAEVGFFKNQKGAIYCSMLLYSPQLP